jgi:hypothetical protein
MRLRPVTLVLFFLAAIVGGAAEQGGAPLEASKKALRELQADQATKPDVNSTGHKPSDGLPQAQVPPPAAMQDFGSRRTNEKELQKKKDRPANWLLDGVDKLGRDARDRKSPGRDNRRDLPEDEEAEPDSSDPDYMLKLYARQKKESAEKTEARQATKARPDPIAPFLQEWLGNSPVRGKFFDEYVRKSDAGPGAGSPTGPAERVSGQSLDHFVRLEDRRVAGPAVPQSNPYLAGFDAPRPFAESESRSMGQSPVAPMPFGSPASLPQLPVAEPDQAPRPADKKPLLLAPSDNEKYFPQQKKF